MHILYHASRIDEFPPIEEPAASARVCHAAAHGDDDGESFARFQTEQFDAKNALPEAVAEAKQETKRLRHLKRTSSRVSIARALTFATLKIVDEPPRRPFRWSTPFVVLYFLVAALGCSAVATLVLTEYLVKSSSDLFANDWPASLAYAMLAFAASAALKAFDRRLVSARVRSVFAWLIFMAGMTAFVIWTIVTAMVFAPDLAHAAMSLVATDQHDLSVALLCSTILADVAFNYHCMSGVEQAIFGLRPVREIANPRHERLTARSQALSAEIDQSAARLGRLAGYIRRVEATRSLVARKAKLDVARARDLWVVAQELGAAHARAQVLNSED